MTSRRGISIVLASNDRIHHSSPLGGADVCTPPRRWVVNPALQPSDFGMPGFHYGSPLTQEPSGSFHASHSSGVVEGTFVHGVDGNQEYVTFWDTHGTFHRYEANFGPSGVTDIRVYLDGALVGVSSPVWEGSTFRGFSHLSWTGEFAATDENHEPLGFGPGDNFGAGQCIDQLMYDPCSAEKWQYARQSGRLVLHVMAATGSGVLALSQPPPGTMFLAVSTWGLTLDASIDWKASISALDRCRRGGDSGPPPVDENVPDPVIWP